MDFCILDGNIFKIFYIFRFPVHYVANYMEQILENKIGKTVPLGVVSEAMNEPVGPVDNIIEKARIYNLRNHMISDFGSLKSLMRTGQFCIILYHLEVLKMFQIYFAGTIFSHA